MDFVETMIEVNQRMSTQTAYPTWCELFHDAHIDNEQYFAMYSDCQHLVRDELPEITADESADIVKRIFYVLSTSPLESMSIATLVSKLDADCVPLHEDYECNMRRYSEVIMRLSTLGIFVYMVTPSGHPLIIPQLQCKGELRSLLDAKFSMALPQVGDVIETLDKSGQGITPGLRFTGKSTKRKTPLNQQDRAVVSLVSRQRFRVDMDIVNHMPYYVPTISDTGLPISEREQEDARTAYYRFVDMAAEAEALDTVIQFPTTQDSRGRFYNLATDPSIRLSLRSPTHEGSLTEFEQELLEMNL